MNKFSLKFLDKQLEQKFQVEAHHEKIQRFNSLVQMELLLSLLSSIYYVVTTAKPSGMITLALVFIVAIGLILVKKFCQKILLYYLIFIFFAFTVLFTESINMSRTTKGFSEDAIALNVPLQLYTYAVLLTKTSWIFCAFYYTSSCIYLFIRVFNLNEWGGAQGHKDLILIGFAFSIIGFAYMSYRLEKTVRGFYKSIYDSDKSLTHFKLLVQNIMPNPIFIIDYNESKIKFFNKSAFEMLNEKKKCDPINSTNFLKRTGKSNDFFLSFEKFINTFIKINNSKEISISKTLENYYKSESVQNINQYDILKENNIKFLTINIRTEDNDSENADDEDVQLNFNSISTKKHFELKITKIYWENQACLLILFNDNTHLCKVIELQSLDEYKNRLLATVSHDLRTPLNGLMGILEVVIPQISDREIKKNLMIGLRSANLLLYMINDILDFSQIILKKIRLNLQSVVIRDIIQETCDLIKFQAKKKKLLFTVKLKRISENHNLITDGNRIKQILLNLLSNSLKFTQKGFIKLSIVDCTCDFGKTIIRFSVKDSGIGIKENDKSKLFKLFGKLNQEDKNINKTGVGLGLTISQGLVKMLNKNEEGIHLKSEFNKGSKFWFFIRSLEDDDENIFSISERLKIKFPLLRPYSNKIFSENQCKKPLLNPVVEKTKEKKVLIVDDDLINILVAQKYLEFFGLKYLTATNGEEAFEVVKSNVLGSTNEITLILMDCNMPVLDGFRASKKILGFLKEVGLPEIPIVAVTANVEVADQEKCFAAGMRKFLTKPVKRKDFGIVLQNFLKITIVN